MRTLHAKRLPLALLLPTTVGPPRASRHLRLRPWRLAVILLLATSSAACGFLLTGSTDPGKVQAIMDSTNARGCIYARASATPWASATTVLVGTWGDPPPSLKECWTTLPPSAP